MQHDCETKRQCLVCKEEKNILVEIFGKYSIYRCSNCGLQFADPIDYSLKEYKKAYSAEDTIFYNKGVGYYRHLTNVSDCYETLKYMDYKHLPAVQQIALKWIKSNIPEGAYVFDIGCGPGRFLMASKKEGFLPLGMDVAEEPIKILKNGGFQVANGSIEDYPVDWPAPSVITLFEVLEHLPDPVGFIRKIRDKFPYSFLLVSVPSPNRFISKGAKWDYPPDHYTRWTEKSLLLVLEQAGYKSKVVFPKVLSCEITGSGIGHLIVKFIEKFYKRQKTEEIVANYCDNKILNPIFIEKKFLRLREMFYIPIAALLNLMGFSGISMLGIGMSPGMEKERELDKKKIILLIPTLACGGAEKVAINISNALPDYIEQTIVLFEKKTFYYPDKGRVISLNVATANRNILIRTICVVKRIYHFRKTVNIFKPDVVLSFMEGANVLNIIVSKSLKNPNRCIVSVHGVLSKTKFRFKSIYRVLMKYLYNRSFKVIAVSGVIKQELIKNFGIYPDKIKVIYNPVDIKNIQAMAKEEINYPLFIKDDIPALINVGRLNEQKGQFLLIKAFAELRKEALCRLIIVGDGELESSLQDLARDLNVEKDVFFLGLQKNPFKYIAKSEIFVLSSLSEGHPNVLIEAMSLGKPVVSFDCEGVKETLAPETPIDFKTNSIERAKYGILVPVGDYKKLAEAIKLLLQDKELRQYYAKASVIRANDFNIHKIISEYLEVCFSST